MNVVAAKQRILVVAPELPHSPLTGAHTRPLSIITALARTYDVTVVGSAERGADLSALLGTGAAVRSLEAAPYARSPAGKALARARQLVSPVPFVSRSHFEKMGRLVQETVADTAPAAMHLVSMYSCWYRDDRVPAVIDLLDVVSGLCEAAIVAHPGRYGLVWLQKARTERTERRELARMAAVIAINAADAARLRRLGVEPAIVPLAVCVPSDAEIGEGPPEADGAEAPVRILFVGDFLHEPNRDAADFIRRGLWPELGRRRLSARLTIAGRAADRVRESSATPGIEYLSDVQDLAPLYRSAHIVLAPLALGGGTKNKTLEAMAWGRPVVGTPQAFSGVEARDGEAFVSAPLDAASMAGVISSLAADGPARSRLAAAGRTYVLRHHTQELVDQRVRDLYRRVLARDSRYAILPEDYET